MCYGHRSISDGKVPGLLPDPQSRGHRKARLPCADEGRGPTAEDAGKRVFHVLVVRPSEPAEDGPGGLVPRCVQVKAGDLLMGPPGGRGQTGRSAGQSEISLWLPWVSASGSGFLELLHLAVWNKGQCRHPGLGYPLLLGISELGSLYLPPPHPSAWHVGPGPSWDSQKENIHWATLSVQLRGGLGTGAVCSPQGCCKLAVASLGPGLPCATVATAAHSLGA